MAPKREQQARPKPKSGDRIDASVPYQMGTPTPSAARNGSRGVVPTATFETGELDPSLFFDQAFNFLDSWSASPRHQDQDLPPLSDVTNSMTTFEEYVPATTMATNADGGWMSYLERFPHMHDKDVEMETPGRSTMTPEGRSGNELKSTTVRLIMEAPSVETTNAVVEVLLKVGAKVSMEADARRLVTLTLEHVSTATVNSVLEVLIRSRTKIRMEANS